MIRFASIIVLAILALTSCSERKTEKREHVIGYLGRAKKNPYLAAERYLQSDGHEVTSTTGVLKFDSNEGVVFSPASSVRSVGDAQRVIDWVSDGGHYVCFLDRGEDYWQDLGSAASHSSSQWRNQRELDEENGLKMLLEACELSVVEDDSGDEVWSRKDASITRGEVIPNSDLVIVRTPENLEFKMQLGGARLIVPDHGEYRSSDWFDRGGQHHFFSRSFDDYYGGRITFISDARAFRNPYLQIEQHAEMLDYIASYGGKVVFSLGKVRSFTSMLGEYAPRALWGLLLLTVLWLWKSLPRFGPLLEVADGDSRNYAQQVKNTGQFLWRHKSADSLLVSLRKSVAKKFGHFDNEYSDDLIDSLSESSKINRELVAEAMNRSDVRDAASMVRISKTLQKLLHSL